MNSRIILNNFSNWFVNNWTKKKVPDMEKGAAKKAYVAGYRLCEKEKATNDSMPVTEKEIDKALDEYEFDATDMWKGDCVPHIPTDWEKLLIKDFVLGLRDL